MEEIGNAFFIELWVKAKRLNITDWSWECVGAPPAAAGSVKSNAPAKGLFYWQNFYGESLSALK